jgi:colicin import membrane protein
MSAERERVIAIAGALLIHVVLIGLLVFSMEHRPETPSTASVKPIVQARAVSEKEVMEPMRRRQAEEVERERRLEESKQQAEEAKRQEEAQRKAEAERKRQAAEEAERRAVEKKRLDALKKKQAKEKALKEAEHKRQEALKRKAEAERKAAEERKKADEAARLKREAELKAKMKAEAERLAQEQQRYRKQQLLSMQMRYMADIRNKVERNWLRPSGSRGSYCRVLIHQIPGGDVVNVLLADCDGDVAFKRSVEAAVRKASPLPAPPDPEVFDREIEFVFEP